MTNSWSRNDYCNQVAVLHFYWNEKPLIKKRKHKSRCSLHCYWNEKLLIKKKTTEIKFAVCTATGMRTSWSRKIWSLCCSWNEIQFLIKKRLAVCATTLRQEVLDQEKTTEIKFAVSKCYWNEKILMKKKNRNLVCSLQCCAWNEKFLIKKKLLTVDPFHRCFSYLNTRFMSKHQKERST